MREMKESRVEWLNSIPNNWEIKRLKNVLYERKENNDPIITENILSLTNDRGVIPYSEKGNQGNKAKENLSGYKLAYKNDIVMNSMNVIIGSVGLSEYFGCVSPVYYMLYTNKYNIKYYNYIFQSKVFQNELRGLGNGILEIRMRIPMEKMNNVIMPIPPIEEQNKIVDFLDKKITEIDNIIIKTKDTIEDFKKYKQRIIEKEFTKIYAPKYKLRYLGELKNGLNFHGNTTYKKIKFLGVGNFKDYLVLDDENMFSDIYLDNEISSEYLLKNNDIIFVRSNGSKELVGRSVLVKNINSEITYSGFCIRFRCTKTEIINNKYLLYFFRSDYFKEILLENSCGMAINNLSQDILNLVKIPIPTLKEQEEVIDRIDKTYSEIEKLILTKQKFIEELEQYKKSLIYEYVTGKKEVI